MMRNRCHRALRPAAAALEERALPSVSALPWPDPRHLTLSFAPDGTQVAGAPSVLYGTLGAGVDSTAWQTTVLRAVQSWAVQGNLNVGLVADAGAPAGTPGPPQGRTGQGDIRLSARPLDPTTVAETVPFDLLGTWSGNVVLNSQAPFGHGDDLFDAVLHEVGHALGLPDNGADSTSVMYPSDRTGVTGPSAADVTGLQALYGTRPADPYESKTGNDTLWTATPLTYLPTAAAPGSASGAIEADLGTASDLDLYTLTVPAGAGGPFAVAVRASGLSLLTPRLTVFDALGQPVGGAVSVDPLNNDVTVIVPSALPGATYYARVEAGQAGLFGIGSYRIAAGAPDVAAAADAAHIAAPETAGVADDGGRNDSPKHPDTLAATAGPDQPGWSYSARAAITRPADVDYYRIKTGNTGAPYLDVSVWGTRSGSLSPVVDVLDSKGNPLPERVLYQDDGMETIEAPQIQTNTWYLVRVAALDPAGTRATGGYFLGLDQRSTAMAFSDLTTDTLQDGHDQVFDTLTVQNSLVYHLDLAAAGGGGNGNAAVKAAIYDASDRPVVSFRTVTGSSATVDVLLAPGSYTLRVVAAARGQGTLAPTTFRLRGLVRGEPIGPDLIDTTQNPTGPPNITPPPDPYNVNPDQTIHPSLALGPVDPSSDPWGP